MGSDRLAGRLLSITRACLPLYLILPDQPISHLLPCLGEARQGEDATRTSGRCASSAPIPIGILYVSSASEGFYALYSQGVANRLFFVITQHAFHADDNPKWLLVVF